MGAALSVVPLTVVINGVEGSEGVDVTPAEVARALGGRRVSVSTSRPSPAAFAAVYQRLLDDGASAVVSVHLSAHLSGTVEAARLAAAEIGPAVSVVDAKSTGMGLGFPGPGGERGGRRRRRLPRTSAAPPSKPRTAPSTLFYVDTLEFLRRGGRINAASALLGTALSVKPILQHGRRQHRAPRQGAHREPRPRPPGGPGHGSRRVTPMWTWPCTTSTAPSAPNTSPRP